MFCKEKFKNYDHKKSGHVMLWPCLGPSCLINIVRLIYIKFKRKVPNHKRKDWFVWILGVITSLFWNKGPKKGAKLQ